MSLGMRVRDRMNVILQMVTTLIAAILLGQLWLFSIALDAMENRTVSMRVAIVAASISMLACIAIWMLIRFFLRREQNETGERA